MPGIVTPDGRPARARHPLEVMQEFMRRFMSNACTPQQDRETIAALIMGLHHLGHAMADLSKVPEVEAEPEVAADATPPTP